MAGRVRHSRTNRTALVAGGAGFLDNFRTRTTENLHALRRDSRFSLLAADVCTPLPETVYADRVYNLACPASPRHYQADPVDTLMISVLGARNLLDVATKSGGRLLQASTSEVYGDPDQHPQIENTGAMSIRSASAPATTKASARRRRCVSIICVVRASMSGSRASSTPMVQACDGRIVSNPIIQALLGLPLTIYGSGEQTRSFGFVTDLIDGLTKLMEVDPNPRTPINIGNPEEYSIDELASMVRSMTGTSSPVLYEPLPSDDPRMRRPDISLAGKVLGWSPRTPVRQGIARTIEWFDATTRTDADNAETRPAPSAGGLTLPLAASAGAAA